MVLFFRGSSKVRVEPGPSRPSLIQVESMKVSEDSESIEERNVVLHSHSKKISRYLPERLTIIKTKHMTADKIFKMQVHRRLDTLNHQMLKELRFVTLLDDEGTREAIKKYVNIQKYVFNFDSVPEWQRKLVPLSTIIDTVHNFQTLIYENYVTYTVSDLVRVARKLDWNEEPLTINISMKADLGLDIDELIDAFQTIIKLFKDKKGNDVILCIGHPNVNDSLVKRGSFNPRQVVNDKNRFRVLVRMPSQWPEWDEGQTIQDLPDFREEMDNSAMPDIPEVAMEEPTPPPVQPYGRPRVGEGAPVAGRDFDISIVRPQHLDAPVIGAEVRMVQARPEAREESRAADNRGRGFVSGARGEPSTFRPSQVSPFVVNTFQSSMRPAGYRGPSNVVIRRGAGVRGYRTPSFINERDQGTSQAGPSGYQRSSNHQEDDQGPSQPGPSGSGSGAGRGGVNGSGSGEGRGRGGGASGSGSTQGTFRRRY